jgi:hypothetical protein
MKKIKINVSGLYDYIEFLNEYMIQVDSIEERRPILNTIKALRQFKHGFYVRSFAQYQKKVAELQNLCGDCRFHFYNNGAWIEIEC